MFEYRLLKEYIASVSAKVTIPWRQQKNKWNNFLHPPMEGKAKMNYTIPKYIVYGPSGDIMHA